MLEIYGKMDSTTRTDSGNQQFVVDNARLQAVYTFADHVLAKGRDRYGQTHWS